MPTAERETQARKKKKLGVAGPNDSKTTYVVTAYCVVRYTLITMVPRFASLTEKNPSTSLEI